MVLSERFHWKQLPAGVVNDAMRAQWVNQNSTKAKIWPIIAIISAWGPLIKLSDYISVGLWTFQKPQEVVFCDLNVFSFKCVTLPQFLSHVCTSVKLCLCLLHSEVFVVKTSRGNWKFQMIIFQVHLVVTQKSNTQMTNCSVSLMTPCTGIVNLPVLCYNKIIERFT